MDEAIPIWLEYADGDLSTAQFLYDNSNVSTACACHKTAV